MPDTIHLNLPADVKYLHVLSAVIDALVERAPGAQPANLSHDLQLAAQEIAANIVEHAYGDKGGRFEATLTLNTGTITLTLQDGGIPFDPATIPQPDLDVPQIGGYGLFLAQQLLDTLDYQRLNGRNHWQLVKKLTSPTPTE